jgi:hypothetical protein
MCRYIAPSCRAELPRELFAGLGQERLRSAQHPLAGRPQTVDEHGDHDLDEQPPDRTGGDA